MNSLLSRKEYIYLEEKHPHVAREIRILWPLEDELLLQYVSKLMYDTRNDTRQGFSLETTVCILRLLTEHSMHPKLPVF